MNRLTYRVAPLSREQIRRKAEDFLQEIAPECLKEAQPLDLLDVVERRLVCSEAFNWISVYPERGGMIAEGDTTRDTDGEIVIRLREDVYQDLTNGGNRGRATCGHELGHGVLHPTFLQAEYGLERSAQSEVKAYECAEWQAWAFAGCLLMPPATFHQLELLTPENVAKVYQVSVDFAATHLKRYK